MFDLTANNEAVVIRMPNSVKEQEVISKILCGDSEQFSWIIDQYQELVMRIVLSHIPGQHIDEVVHRVFIAAFTSLGGYRREAPFRNWLARIALRTCHTFWREHYRRREMRFSALSTKDTEWLASVASDKAQEQFSREQAQQSARNTVFWAFERLSPEDRSVLTLVHLQGLSISEAAEQLAWSQAKVKVRAFRARKALRRVLEKLAEEDE